MRIDQAIKDRMDRTLIARGTILDEYHIDALKKLGVTGIYVSEGEEDPEPAKPEPTIPPQIQKTINQMRKADPAKVNLSESVKKRVSEGIQYLYNNPESQEFTNTASSITSNLMKAITENDAIAVD
ncbi:MAG: HD-GYP domain-containing protein, partial [Acetatifactor sp.]|nr:HD-GYP domain-containing protein [Acetatifactor sp.]